jgi:hypothetical protein
VKFFWLILAFCSTSLWGVVLVVRGAVKISGELVTCSVWWSGPGTRRRDEDSGKK